MADERPAWGAARTRVGAGRREAAMGAGQHQQHVGLVRPPHAPSAIVIPFAMSRGNHPALLSRWSVPMAYGSQRLTVKGRVDYEPVRGAWYVALDPSTNQDPQPVDVSAQILGPLPGVFLTATSSKGATVLGESGELFAQVGHRPPTSTRQRQKRGGTGVSRWCGHTEESAESRQLCPRRWSALARTGGSLVSLGLAPGARAADDLRARFGAFWRRSRSGSQLHPGP